MGCYSNGKGKEKVSHKRKAIYYGVLDPTTRDCNENTKKTGLSAGTGKLCFFGHLGLVFIWTCFVFCLLLLLYYVIYAPVLTERTKKTMSDKQNNKFTRASQFFVHFFAFFARLRRENA